MDRYTQLTDLHTLRKNKLYRHLNHISINQPTPHSATPLSTPVTDSHIYHLARIVLLANND